MEFIFDDFDLMPYVRMTRNGKWENPRAQAYMHNQASLGWLYKMQMQAHGWTCLPPRQELYVSYVIQRESLFKFDMDNGLKALLDAAKGIVFENDLYFTVDLGGVKRKGHPLVKVVMGLVAELDASILSCEWRARLLGVAPRLHKNC